MNYTEQPAGMMGAYSPIWYQAFDANYVNAGFYYQFEVYVWTGAAVIPGATTIPAINVKPDVYAGGRAKIDIHKIVQQYIERDFVLYGAYQPDINDGAKYIAVEVTGYWDGGGPTATIASNIQKVMGGYTYLFEGFNFDYGSKEVYTDRSKVYLTEQTEEFFIWFDASTITAVNVGAYSEAINPITDLNQHIQGIDIVELMSNAGLTGTNSTISFTGSSVTIEVEYKCQNRYGEVLVHFRNRYGVYESFVFNALSRRMEDIKRETYQQPVFQQTDLTQSFGNGLGIDTSFLVNSGRSMVVNTDYLTPEENEVIRQIMLSRNIWLVEDGKQKSVRVGDSAFNEKTINNDKLVQYTMSLKYNQPLLNTITR